jgi:hypothetical protein
MTRKRRAIIPIVLVTLVLPASALGAPAVTNTNDSGPGSLRQALADAVTGESIDIPAGTYTLTSGQLSVNGKSLTLVGAGARSTIVTAGGASRVFLLNGNPTRLSGMTITGGRLDAAAETDECHGGAGICNANDLELTDVAVVGNVANMTTNSSNAVGGAGIYNNGDTVTMTRTTVAGNRATVEISNSLILAAGGGGYFNNGDGGAITNTTISGNTLTANGACTQATGCRHGGGGVYNNGDTITFTNSTVADNSVGGTAPTTGGNYFNDNSPAAVFKNSIVSGGSCDTFNAPVSSSSGGNVESAATCGFTAATDKPNSDPLLAALADNGGQTDTRALSPGSPAIDAAVACPPPDTDQRGVARPVGGACDSGAFELGPSAATPPPPAGTRPPACADKVKPITKLSRKGVKRRGSTLRLKGRARDRGAPCPSGLRRVLVSLARVSGRNGVNCRFLRSPRKFQLTRPKNCRRPVLFNATGKRSWRFVFRLNLRPGKYRVQARAIDKARNKETPKKRRNIVFFTVR